MANCSIVLGSFCRFDSTKYLLRVQRQAAVVSVFLRFFRLGILAFQVRERDVQRFVPQADSDGVHRHAFFVQRVGVGLAEAMKLSALDAGFLRNSLQLPEEVPIGFPVPVWKHEIVRHKPLPSPVVVVEYAETPFASPAP